MTSSEKTVGKSVMNGQRKRVKQRGTEERKL